MSRRESENTLNTTELPMAQKGEREVTYGSLLFSGSTSFTILTDKCSGKSLR
ncbi:hypothetical protein HMPREF9141_1705 [Prevotella multiformis DSM 16608]|uniref:Uncharacterized protein n=1 Tax=Prevotella multiformis DSM 16608 TaxID=888743 RepID=F0F7Y8_9BACT|nr:hypothetical protein HMPREF9141_1705 [Prevotella multiformis DSM 16608]